MLLTDSDGLALLDILTKRGLLPAVEVEAVREQAFPSDIDFWQARGSGKDAAGN